MVTLLSYADLYVVIAGSKYLPLVMSIFFFLSSLTFQDLEASIVELYACFHYTHYIETLFFF